jgi:hypothetical protein
MCSSSSKRKRDEVFEFEDLICDEQLEDDDDQDELLLAERAARELFMYHELIGAGDPAFQTEQDDLFLRKPEVRRMPPNRCTLEDRSTLVQWMMEVCADLCLCRRTFHLAVQIVDRVDMKAAGIDITTYQGLGAAAMHAAAVFEEVHPPVMQNFATATAGDFSRAQITRIQERSLTNIDHRLFVPTALDYMHFYMGTRVKNQVYMILSATYLDIMVCDPLSIRYAQRQLGRWAAESTVFGQPFKLPAIRLFDRFARQRCRAVNMVFEECMHDIQTCLVQKAVATPTTPVSQKIKAFTQLEFVTPTKVAEELAQVYYSLRQ